jgi:acyl-CoA synthetase (AMP-forming)/AMP-acid ligase II
VSAAATLPALLGSSVARFGEREALISARGRWTYATLAARVEGVAGGLAARGVGRGSHVGLLAPNWPEWVAIAFAVWRLGGVLVPLSTLHQPRELHHALTLADV